MNLLLNLLGKLYRPTVRFAVDLVRFAVDSVGVGAAVGAAVATAS